MFLIIEKNGVLAEIYHRLLLNAGYHGCIKSNYGEALNVDDKENFNIDLVVLSLGKDADGSDKGDIIKIMGKFRKCKIFLIIDEMTPSIRKIIGDHKIDLWLTKPFIPSELLKRISLAKSKD